MHNWTFATLEFLVWAGEDRGLLDALGLAGKTGELAEPMSLAHAVQAPASEDVAPEKVADESGDVFYATLGERLVGILAQPEAAAVSNLRVLLNRCMAVGPRGEDAALLYACRRAGLGIDSEAANVAVYRAKVRRNSELRLSLTPLLRVVTVPQCR